ncbi:hypothetical protein ACFSKN_12295 [Mariniflexile gromovii]|uniref:Uncharacterized protein n=1 Tax=Mariniflexile gromovii TaxID=362523 RepID=A0ABS4BV41_9FLAO|nr:hypothetical protein [Mariniflexile gromovii]MBP0904432.1 hypothetical protein [Mariniflexile gromovii]
MKTKMRTLLLIPFFALLLFSSCQEEKIEITEPTQEEALVPQAQLTSLISATSKMDGSKDNIIDGATCISVKLPVIVKVRGIEIRIDSEADYEKIKHLYDELEDDIDRLDIIFPITITTSEHEEITIESGEQLSEFIAECKDDEEVEEREIRCIDFKFPIAFSVYNRDFSVINVVNIENKKQLYLFMKRVKNAEVLASLNFPVTMVLKNGTTLTAENNEQLRRIIETAKDSCDIEDFSKERLENYLKKCPWIVYEFKRNNQDNTAQFEQYAINFKEDGVVVMRSRNGDMLTGTWGLRSTRRGVLLKMAFENLADFTLEWLLYDFEDGKFKIYEEGGNRIIIKRNCDIVIDITKERIENYLQECYWRIARLSINGTDKEKEYIGTPLKFLPNNEVKLRINGEFVTGTYEIGVRNIGFILQITLDGRPDLKLEWLITFLESGLIKLENANSKMVLERHCFDSDDDLKYIDAVIAAGTWEVAKYDDGLVHVVDPTINFFGYTVDFLITGRIKVTDPNNGVTAGSWLAYRNEGLYLGMLFANQAPFNELTFRWKIKAITANRIELVDLSANGEIERTLILEKKN